MLNSVGRLFQRGARPLASTSASVQLQYIRPQPAFQATAIRAFAAGVPDKSKAARAPA